MTSMTDSPDRYGLVSRFLHWGMAALFAAQFVRETLWTYHTDLGITLFLLVVLRGAWGLWNLRNRPSEAGLMGFAANCVDGDDIGMACHIGLGPCCTRAWAYRCRYNLASPYQA